MNNGLTSIPRFLASAFFFVSILCCSVKEDRDSCPCILRFDMSEAFNDSDGSLTMVITGPDGFARCDTLRADGDSIYDVLVPRREITVDFYTPYGALRNPLEGYRPDRECDPVWHWSEVLTAEGEKVSRKVRPHKDYCRLSVQLVGEPGVRMPYSLLFVSNVRGYLPGGSLLDGLFVERENPDSGGCCEVNLLRQKDSSLMMEIAPSDVDGVSLRSFALGEYLSAAGYDWTAPDLEDVEITLDFASTTLSISTGQRTSTMEFNVVI